MNFGIADVIAILVITIGPLKAAIVYATLTANADKALRRAIAFRTVMVATIVIVVFIVFGEFILSIFHISLAALKLAGGLILLLFALGMVMGDEKKGGGPEGPVTIAVATYPLAMPLMATPQGIVAVVTLAAARPGLPGAILLVVLTLVIMALNLVVLLSADKLLGKGGGGAMQVVGRVIGLLLAGLAIQLMIMGFTDLGLISAAGQAH
jgi:multiple antibiotic resistance protein